MVWNVVFGFTIAILAVKASEAAPSVVWPLAAALMSLLILCKFGKFIPDDTADAGWWLPLLPTALS